MASYRPLPISTEGVELGIELAQLIERLAENNHDLWAQARIAEGWTRGPRRDDERKEHPGLVPYSELPEGEKEYDRLMAVEALKVILALGFRVQPPVSGVDGEASDRDGFTRLGELRDLLASNAALRLNELLAIWRAHEERLWRTEPALYVLLARRFLQLGDPLLAHEVLVEGRHRGEGRDPRLEHLYGLALARSGAVGRANEIARGLAPAVADDAGLLEEVLGLLGRTHKDLALGAVLPEQREHHLECAFSAYRAAFQRTRGSYPGINAATMAVLRGSPAEAEALARQVREAALAELAARRARGEDAYWQLATLGEAALILGENGEAEGWYTEALQNGGQRYGDVASTRRQARLIAEHRGADPVWLDRLLRVPRVVVFAGHMLAGPDRATPRLPEGAQARVRTALEERLRDLDAGFGIASASCGSDILFLELLGRLGGQTSVVLPYPQERFIEAQVALGADGDWVARFHRVMERATEIHVAAGAPFPASGVLFEYSSLLMLGLASMQARALDAELAPLVVWDGKDTDSSTAAVVRCWRDCGQSVQVIPLPVTDVVDTARLPAQPDGSTGEAEAPDSCIGGILFADVVGFSRLTSDDEIIRFVREFLGSVAAVLDSSLQAPLVRNTWGDGLYFIFPSVRAAGLQALALCDMISRTDWSERKLPADLSIRVALHAGPVISFVDPVTGQPTWSGRQVTRAARMEPITPPGTVYASREFAALATAQGVVEFRCEPVGRVRLDKKEGVMPLFVLRTTAGRV